jgi:hypothetical protein
MLQQSSGGFSGSFHTASQQQQMKTEIQTGRASTGDLIGVLSGSQIGVPIGIV